MKKDKMKMEDHEISPSLRQAMARYQDWMRGAGEQIGRAVYWFSLILRLLFWGWLMFWALVLQSWSWHPALPGVTQWVLALTGIVAASLFGFRLAVSAKDIAVTILGTETKKPHL